MPTATSTTVDDIDENDTLTAGSEDGLVDDTADDADDVEHAGDTLDDEHGDAGSDDQPSGKRRSSWQRWVLYFVMPAVAAVLALSAGYLKWEISTARDADAAAVASLQVAKDSTVALLSYSPDTVVADLGAARDLLTGDFRDAYTSLTNDVVIPGAQEQRISAVATVPAASIVVASENRAVAMVFVNQATTIGDGAPSATASTVKVTLDKVDGRWLISAFEPI